MKEKNILELINLKEWKKQKEILYELHREWGINITSRDWRLLVEKQNQQFIEGNAEYYITHSSLGYKLTKDYKEAKVARDDYLKRAFNMIKKAHDCDKAFNQRCNYKIDFEKGILV